MKKLSMLLVLFTVLISAVALASLSDLVINDPVDGNVTDQTSVNLNWTLIANAYDVNATTEFILYLNGTETHLNYTNASCIYTPNYNYTCNYTSSGLGQYGPGYDWNVTANATNLNSSGTHVNQTLVTDTYNFKVDTQNPIFDLVRNWTTSLSVLSFNIDLTEYTGTTCFAEIIVNSISQQNKSCTVGDTTNDGDVNISGTVEGSDITGEGLFTVNYRITDGIGRENYTSETGVKVNLYSGWNVLAYPSANSTGGSVKIHQVCDGLQYCTMASHYNNTGGNFVTYSESTPGVNNDTLIGPGDPVLVYVTSDDYMLAKDDIPSATSANIVEELYNVSWNLMGLTADANLSSVLSADNMTTSYQGVRMASHLNQTTYMTCRNDTSLCAGTSLTPTNIPLVKGYAVWVRTNTDYMRVNRSLITG